MDQEVELFAGTVCKLEDGTIVRFAADTVVLMSAADAEWTGPLGAASVGGDDKAPAD